MLLQRHAAEFRRCASGISQAAGARPSADNSAAAATAGRSNARIMIS
jgi:hypothetical protein